MLATFTQCCTVGSGVEGCGALGAEGPRNYRSSVVTGTSFWQKLSPERESHINLDFALFFDASI